jgi:peptidoglycan/LPS O-acetylase OafA/YrhL
MRNGNIERLRFFFAVSVVMHHALLNHYRGGWIGVEFFFMITGYFMSASTIEHHKDETSAVTLEESEKCSDVFLLLPACFLYITLAIS